MALDQEDILTTLRERLLDAPSVDSGKVAWINMPFKPDLSTYYIRENLIITSMRQIANGTQRAMGIYRLDVFTPAGKGTKAALAIARAIQDAYPFPDNIVGAVTLHIDRAEVLSGRNVGEAWFAYPVPIQWRTHRAT